MFSRGLRRERQPQTIDPCRIRITNSGIVFILDSKKIRIETLKEPV